MNSTPYNRSIGLLNAKGSLEDNLYLDLFSDVLITKDKSLPVPAIFFSFSSVIKVAPSSVPKVTPIWKSPVGFSSTSISSE